MIASFLVKGILIRLLFGILVGLLVFQRHIWLEQYSEAEWTQLAASKGIQHGTRLMR